MIDQADELDPAWLAGIRRIGVTAGASAPENLVMAVVERLRMFGATRVSELDGTLENVTFHLPKALAAGVRAAKI
jgi:4-hydroxy-3-methylbut-2-enyl diphosphate reductase